MTLQEIRRIALEQSAIDLGCRTEDFAQGSPVAVESVADPRARRYLTLPFDCNLVSYGDNVVASVRADLREEILAYLRAVEPAHCFETPAIHRLSEVLEPKGLRLCFMAEYFLPDPKKLVPEDSPYTLRLLTPKKFAHLYLPEWSNALCERRKELDRIAIGAYDNDRLIGLAGASADCDGMWQIGIDVLPAYRKQGIASTLTTRLALAILELGKVPFYCAAWSNIPSVRNAIRSGFVPAWVELTAKPAEFVASLQPSYILTKGDYPNV